MKGTILNYSSDTRTGLILGINEIRYEFSANEYRSESEINIGQTVDFEIDADNNTVTAIYALQKDKDTSQEVIKVGKETLEDTLSVFQLLQRDPATGLKAALEALGDNRAFNTGIVLCVLFVFSAWIATLKITSTLLGFLNVFNSGFSGFSNTNLELVLSAHFRIILISSVPAIGIILVLWAIAKIFKGSGNYKQFTFATGVSLFPITCFLFVLWLLGYSSSEFVSLLSIFCFTTLILLLNTTLIGLIELSARNALLLVPIILVADTFITRVVVNILY
ncbi:MAG: hypothetical protein KA716_19690 [Gloeotrichia echinulata DEX184]|nr:hypothetical protein [Gloeotrichia echinulata DEX184]